MYNLDIGKKIKELRLKAGYTLNDMSEKTGLSTGYLSQLERGLTTIAIDTLIRISEIFQVDISYFVEKKSGKTGPIVKTYERDLMQVLGNRFIYYSLSNTLDEGRLYPRYIEILPGGIDEQINVYKHEGEEFVYVLEGILTLLLDGEEHSLYPGDTAHYSSKQEHNWVNKTNKTVKVMSIHVADARDYEKEEIYRSWK